MNTKTAKQIKEEIESAKARWMERNDNFQHVFSKNGRRMLSVDFQAKALAAMVKAGDIGIERLRGDLSEVFASKVIWRAEGFAKGGGFGRSTRESCDIIT